MATDRNIDIIRHIPHSLRYAEKEKEVGSEQLRELERVVMLKVVDQKWMDHIDAMDELKNGIGLRAYGQQDPVVKYRIEGMDMFDEMVNDMLVNELKTINAKVLILDGYPRTVCQVKEFDKLMSNFDSAVIFRDTPKELILERVKNRRICEKCGKAHDVGDGVCECGGRLVKRRDDRVLPERLAEYEEMTKPAVVELKNEGKNFFWYEGTAEGCDIAREFLASNKKYL